MLEHEVQIWNTVALNCLRFSRDLIKNRPPRYKGVSSVTFALADFLGFLNDLQPLPQLPRGGKGACIRDGKGGVSLSLSLALR